MVGFAHPTAASFVGWVTTHRSALWCVVALTYAGCAIDPPKPESAPARRSAAPRYNLTGFSAAFKEGYADACATPRRRNAQRIKDDADYQIGWQDGSSVCRAR